MLVALSGMHCFPVSSTRARVRTADLALCLAVSSEAGTPPGIQQRFIEPVSEWITPGMVISGILSLLSSHPLWFWRTVDAESTEAAAAFPEMLSWWFPQEERAPGSRHAVGRVSGVQQRACTTCGPSLQSLLQAGTENWAESVGLCTWWWVRSSSICWAQSTVFAQLLYQLLLLRFQRRNSDNAVGAVGSRSVEEASFYFWLILRWW